MTFFNIKYFLYYLRTIPVPLIEYVKLQTTGHVEDRMEVGEANGLEEYNDVCGLKFP